MPMIRYQIRSEYGLAEPELYQGADKDDPEAILEGVAMTGLVGVLRQLGDLAEFAAEIFHNLHEEVMTTAARGHGMMLRVQQLEAEFPLVEKAFFSHYNHSNLAYTEGIDWHCNVELDQNLITRGDMPRFILNSYEECRGPPRLFTLDKFDVAGSGACLKRYTDPSFFKMELKSSGIRETDILREKKGRKIKKKGSRWKNAQTLESLMSPKKDSDLSLANSNKVHDKTGIRVVKLKSRHGSGIDTSKSKRLMELLLEMHKDVQKAITDDSCRDSQSNMELVVLDDSAVEVHDINVDTPVKFIALENGSFPISPAIKETISLAANDLEHKRIDDNFSKDPTEPFSEVEESMKVPMSKSNISASLDNTLYDSLDNTLYDSLDHYAFGNSQKTASLEVVGQGVEADGCIDGYRSDEFGSEQENFMDAVNTMDSEIETDVECISKPDTVAISTEAYSVVIDSEGPDDTQDQSSALDQPQAHFLSNGSVAISSIPSESNKLGGVSSLPDLDSSRSIVGVELVKDEVTYNLDSNSDKTIVGNHDHTSETLCKNTEMAESVYSDSDKTCKVTPEGHASGSEIDDNSQYSSFTDSSSHTLSSLLVLNTSHNANVIQAADEELEAGPDLNSVNSIGEEMLKPNAATCFISDNALQRAIDGPILGAEIGNISQSFSVTDPATMCTSIEPRERLKEQLLFSNSKIESSSSYKRLSGQMENEKTDSADHQYELFPEDTPDALGFFVNSGNDSSTPMSMSATEEKHISIERDGESSSDENNTFPSMLVFAEDTSLARGQSEGSYEKTFEHLQHDDSDLNLPCNNGNRTVETVDHNCSTFGLKDVDFQENSSPDDHLKEHITEVTGELRHETLADIASDEAKETVDVGGYVDVSSTVSKNIDLAERARPEHMLELISGEVDVGTDITDLLSVMKDNENSIEEVFGYWESAPSPLTIQYNESENQMENNLDAYSQGAMISGFPVHELSMGSELVCLDDLGVANHHELIQMSSDSKSDVGVNNDEDFASTALEKELEDLTEKERDIEFPNEKPTELVTSLNSETEGGKEAFSDVIVQNLIANTSKDLIDYSVPPIADNKLREIGDSSHNNDEMVGFELHHEDCSCDNSIVEATNDIQSQLDDDIWDVEDSPHKNDEKVELRHGYFSSDNGTVGVTNDIPTQLEDDVSIDKTSNQLETSETCSADEALLDTHNNQISVSLPDLPYISLAALGSELHMKDLFGTEDSKLNNENNETIQYTSDPIDVHPDTEDTLENSLKSEEFSPKSLDQIPETKEENEDIVAYDSFSDLLVFPTEELSSGSPQEGSAFVRSLVTSFPEVSTIPEFNGGSSSSLNQYITHCEVISDNTSGEPSETALAIDHHIGSNKFKGIGVVIPNDDFSGQLEPNSSISFTSFDPCETGLNDSASFPSPLYVENSPPLPPLPPLQWRSGKLQLKSLVSDGDLCQYGTNPFDLRNIEQNLINGQLAGETGAQLENQFPHPPLRLSELPPIAEAGQTEEDIIVLHTEKAQTHDSLVSSSSEQGVNLDVPDTSEGLGFQTTHSVASFSLSDDKASKHSLLLESENVHTLADGKSQSGQVLVGKGRENDKKHENNEVNVKTENALELNDFSAGSVSDGTRGGESLDLEKSLDLPPTSWLEVPQHWYPHLLEQNDLNQFSILRKDDDDRLAGKPLKIRNRPKDPLIEAVAKHDRSMLRKVSNQIPASDKPEAEQRNTLLEQIRSKAFNLKPAAAAKQNIKGPSTNLKVAAIIQKANAIRQACVGSDEDEDEDSWNDA